MQIICRNLRGKLTLIPVGIKMVNGELVLQELCGKTGMRLVRVSSIPVGVVVWFFGRVL